MIETEGTRFDLILFLKGLHVDKKDIFKMKLWAIEEFKHLTENE